MGRSNNRPLPNNSVRTKHSTEGGHRSVTAKMSQLDSVDGMKSTTDKCVMRIDVEGLAYEVLLGASKSLNQCRLLYIEVEDYEIWDGQKTVFDIYPLLEGKGFVPVSRDVQTPGQYNVMWLRKEDYLERKFRSRVASFYSRIALLNEEALSAKKPKTNDEALPTTKRNNSPYV